MSDFQQSREAAGIGPSGTWERPDSVQNLQLRMLIAAWLVVMVAASGFAIGLVVGVRGEDVKMLALALATFAVGCIPLVLDQGRPPRARHVMLAIVSLVFMMHFVVPALMLYLPAVGPIDASSTSFTNLMPPDVVYGQLLALLGLVSLQTGYAIPVGRLVASRIPAPQADWSPTTCLAVAIGFLAVGWLFSFAGLLGILPSTLGSGVTGVFATGRNYANVLLAYVYLRYRSNTAALLIGMNVVALLLLGLLTSDKLDALIGLAIVVLTSMLLTKRIRTRWVVLGFVAVIVIYPASEFVRRDLLSGASAAELVMNPGYTLGMIGSFAASGEISDYLETGFEATAHRIDGLGIASVIIRDTPGVSPFQNGRTLGLFFVSFIPRILWPGKPNINIGQWITDVYGSGPHITSNTAPTPIGEFYLNFGVAGIVFGLMFLGIVLRLAHETLSQRGATAPSILAQSVIVVIFGIQFAGSVAGVYSQVAFTLVPLLLLNIAIRTFTRMVPHGGPPVGSGAKAPWIAE